MLWSEFMTYGVIEKANSFVFEIAADEGGKLTPLYEDNDFFIRTVTDPRFQLHHSDIEFCALEESSLASIDQIDPG
jgi:hypothetical protein